jgi:hypothetical protein
LIKNHVSDMNKLPSDLSSSESDGRPCNRHPESSVITLEQHETPLTDSDLMLENFQVEQQDHVRQLRLAERFPKISVRLDKAVRLVGLDDALVCFARRHVLCAEALAEVLEQWAQHGRRCTSEETEQEIIAAYSEGVVARLAQLMQRPTELNQIQQSYLERDLQLVAMSSEHGLATPVTVTCALEQASEYRVILKRLSAAGLIGEPTVQERSRTTDGKSEPD